MGILHQSSVQNEIKIPEEFSRTEQQISEIVDRNFLNNHSLNLGNGKVQNMLIATVLEVISESEHSSEIKHLWLNDNNLFGTVKWDSLPRQLQTLRIEGNQITGTIDWKALPSSLKTIVVSSNMATMSSSDAPASWKLFGVYDLMDEDSHKGIWKDSENYFFVFIDRN